MSQRWQAPKPFTVRQNVLATGPFPGTVNFQLLACRQYGCVPNHYVLHGPPDTLERCPPCKGNMLRSGIALDRKEVAARIVK